MSTRLRYPEIAPDGYAALSAFGHYVNTGTALEPVLLGLVYLRASVLNGCDFCTELHKAELRKHHEPESRIEAVLDGPDAPQFTPREQAALRWTDTLTRLAGGPAPDEAYTAISVFFHGKDLVDLTYAIANINAWNRMGVAFRPEWRPRSARAASAVEIRRGSGADVSTEGSAQSGHAPVTAGAPSTASQGEEDGGKVGQD
jgi:AhpD family alkylhydroperoxidase